MTEQAVLQDARRYLAVLHKRRGIVLTCLGVSLAATVLHNYTSVASPRPSTTPSSPETPERTSTKTASSPTRTCTG